MNLVSTVSLVGSLASILGAAWAWRQAYLAKGAATKAEKIKKQLCNITDFSNLSELKGLNETTQKTIRKYACSSNENIDGVDVPPDVELVYKLLEKINELNHLFPTEEFAQSCKNLELPLQKLLAARTSEEIKQHGYDVYGKLRPILLTVRKETRKKKEDITE